ncbi:MAG: Gfo/Idh/MocA family oxidoreductase [Chloroflexi bacterium]|nr:Gfo/Idh/MocA family oxidoreductase [Chloroflexota bacterium]
MIRLALVGCGRNAAALAAAAAASDLCRLEVAADIEARAAGDLARAAEARAHVGDLASLLESNAADVQAVIVNTPNDSHADIALAAIAAGRHVLVEKPLALSADAADEVRRRANEAGVRLMVAHTLRFMPANVQVHRALAAGELGKPGMLRSHRWLRRFPGPPGGWKHDPARSGGLCVHEAVHEIDQALWLIGERPTHVHAQAQPDLLQIHLGYESGAMALCGVATGLPLGSGYYSLALIGSLGAAYADDHHNVQLIYRGARPQAVMTDQRASGVRAQLDEFARAITEGREPSVSGADAVAALQIAEAAAASSASGQTAHLTETGYVLA